MPSPSAIVGCARTASASLLGSARQHRHLHDCHDFAGRGADHRKAENAIVILADKNFHEALSLAGRLRPQHRITGNLATRTMMPWRSASRSLSPTWASGGSVNMQYGISRSRVLRFPPSDFPDNPKIVLRHVRELRAAGAFPDRPDLGRGCFEALIHSDVAATVHLHTGLPRGRCRRYWQYALPRPEYRYPGFFARLMPCA